MISVSNLSVHFVGRYLFDGISFTINQRDKIGLVGKNGAGKSTLLKILAGNLEGESGGVYAAGEVTIGYLPQDIVTTGGRSVYEEAATAFAETKRLEHRINELSDEIAAREDYESEDYHKLIEELSDSTERFKLVGGHSMEADIERVLTGLGFEHDDMARDTGEFSGGWQMRVELAKILLQRPSCILLDEPTNHLDIESIQWVEEFLHNYDGAVVLVSHDRAFLDAVTNRTIEISLGKVYDYNAAYSAYVEMRRERREQQLKAYRNQQKHIEETEKFIERFRYKATKAVQVQSRIKQLEKLDRIEIDEDDSSRIHFRFPPTPRSGRIVVDIKELSKRYDDTPVLNDIELTLERGDRVAFVGKNGAGKSTLSRIIVGQESCDGQCELGHNTILGYYAQHQAEMLNSNSTVFDVIDEAATGEMRSQVRDLLGAFLFSGDDVFKKIKVLSGGEKSRLALAKLLLDPINLLVLDEPTNHLDMVSKDVLKRALMEFDGALVVVSHDREFLEGLTSRVIEFRDGGIVEHSGDIREFLRARNVESFREFEAEKDRPQSTTAAGGDAASQDSAAEPGKNAWKDRKKKQAESRRLKRAVSDCEADIVKLEERIAGYASQINAPGFYDKPESANVLRFYEKTQADLEEKMTEWSALGDELSALDD